MSSALHRGKGKSSQFPDQTSHLVLMLMHSRHPPLPPLVDHWQAKLVLHPVQPGHGSSDGDTVIDITRGDPDPEATLDEDGVEPVTSIFELGVIGGDIVTAGLESLEGDVEVLLDGGLVEEMRDAVHILTDDIIIHHLHSPSMGQTHMLHSLRHFHLLEETLGIQIEHAGTSSVELLISNSPHTLAAGTIIPENACSLDVIIEFLVVVAMVEQIFVLVDTQIDVISGLVALPGISAGIVDHDSLQVDGHLPAGQFVASDDLVGKVGHVDAGVALSSDVEVVLLEIGELVEEGDQCLVVVHGHTAIVVLEVSLGSAEAHSSGRFDVEQIGLLVPSEGVVLKISSALLEDKRTVLVGHAQERGAAGTTVEPEDDGIVIGVLLGVEEDVVEGCGVEVEIS